ncbi:hypothetical protein CLIM01_01746 [Colletotrichum limetticola]|uniref:Uncharacterized protein n=1 Tax=Colletotrichum limetticola TaxID=1209924 RepID=A0ABQ9QAR7_9PEZI|nr:hypothetical protein CLIM01_01746 [Colletotrichum limetticola]
MIPLTSLTHTPSHPRETSNLTASQNTQ